MVTVVHLIGHTAVTIHSPHGVAEMNSTEQRNWIKNELRAGNPNVVQTVKVMSKIGSQGEQKKSPI